MSEAGPASADWPNQPVRAGGVFSDRLDTFLDQLLEGVTPNAGRFCAYCYNPLPPGLDRCDHCSRDTAGAVSSLPTDIVEMHRLKRRRESLVVNSFAYIGLGMGLALFLIMVAINVLYLDKALWFFLLATLVFLLGSRLLAGIVGGVIGDEVGYRYANKKLAEEWQAHLAQRDAAQTP
ncbi:MAG TPA: YrzE family protein [Dehalococcoidia bacterium]|nr:YrzE family protein [Dehalococcoidia bacterium]